MKHRKKADLPSKLCLVCERPFTWRRKWAKDWDQVRYCSERCRRDAKTSGFSRLSTASRQEPA